jgi:hypothetical protein
VNEALAGKVRKSFQKFLEKGDCLLVFGFAFISDRSTIMSQVIFEGAAGDELSGEVGISAVLENAKAFQDVRMGQCVEGLFF